MQTRTDHSVCTPQSQGNRPLTGTKLYCLVTEAHRCEKLVQSFYAVVPGWNSNPRLLVASPTLYRNTTTPTEEEGQEERCNNDLHTLSTVLCGLLTIERAWSGDHATSSVTAVLPPPGQRCGTVCLNSFGNQTSPSDNSNYRWKRLCLVSWAAAPCVWTLRALTRNLLTYSVCRRQTGRNGVG